MDLEGGFGGLGDFGRGVLDLALSVCLNGELIRERWELYVVRRSSLLSEDLGRFVN